MTKLINLLKKLVSINSIYPDEKRIGNFVYDYLQNQRLIVEKFNIGYKNKIRNNLLICQKSNRFSKSKKILLYGHLDTVGLVNGWKTNPFKLVIKNNKAYGLGAYDMKTGLSVIINILLNKQDLPVKAVFGVGEENIAEGIYGLKNHPFLKDIAFSLVPEPNFDKGENAVCLGRTGRAVIKCLFKGEAKHLFFAKKSVNAIKEAEIFDHQVKKIKLNINNKFQRTIIVARAFHSEAVGMSVPGQALLEYDVMLTPPETTIQVLAKFQKLGKELYKNKKIKFMPVIKLKERKTPFLEPYEISRKSQYLKFITKGIYKALKQKGKYYYRNSVADENVLVKAFKIPSFTLGPNGGNAHSANEYAKLSSMKNVYRIYLAIINQYMNSL